MAKDPGFLFYPGDYLRDTQNLSEKAQVAYDRIMCEHMRNICIRQEQVNFFTKRLNEDEKAELMFILSRVDGGFQIEWVAESISKRKAYSESRRKNREGKSNDNISSTYDKHMENENENEKEDKKESEKEIIYPFDSENFMKWWILWKEYKKKEHKFQYKSTVSEQGALKELSKLSNGNEATALQIIEQSISNGWKGFFELKQGTKKYNSDPVAREVMREKIGAEIEKKWKK